MEAHLVHFNAKYGDFESAVTKKDGLVVVAFFIQAFGEMDCSFFRKISDSIPNIRKTGSKCDIDAGNSMSIIIQLSAKLKELNN